MEDVRRRIPHTIRRKGIYYFQRRVPVDLVEAFGFVHFKESLGTADPIEAERKLHAAEALYFQVIDAKRVQLREGAAPVVPPAALKLNALRTRVREYVSSETFQRRTALTKRWKQQPGSRDRARAEIAATFEALRDPLDEFTVQRLREVAVALFPENRFDQPALGPIHNLRHPINGPFRDFLRRGLLEIERRSLNFLDGDSSGAGQDVFFPLHVPTKVSERTPRAQDGTQGITLAELSATWLAEHAKGSARQQRKEQVSAAHRLVLRFFGPTTHAASLDSSMCREFRDLLAELPRDVTKRFGETQALQEIAAKAREDNLRTMARATQETYLGALRDMTAWAKRERILDHDPAEKLKSLTPDRPRARVDFSDELLKQICLEQFMRKWDRMDFTVRSGKGLSDATRFWVPRIGLFSGMRQNEICQLDVADVRRTKSGTPYISVDDAGDDKQLKNASSRRAVPVHAQLIEAGLLRYVSAVEEAGHQKLFPDLERSEFGHYGEKLSKWITRQLRSASYPPGVDFHAFRHTFAQALRYIDAPTVIAARLGGWTTKAGVMDRYGGAFSDKWIDHLNATLQKIDYGVARPHIF